MTGKKNKMLPELDDIGRNGEDGGNILTHKTESRDISFGS